MDPTANVTEPQEPAPRRIRGTTVTHELPRADSPLRRVLVDVGFEPIVVELRTQLVALADSASLPDIPVPRNLASLVGTAADIRLRWWLGGVVEVMPTAENGRRALRPVGRATVERLMDAVGGLTAGDHELDVERRLSEAAMALASAEVLGRIGRIVPIPVDEMTDGEFLAWCADGIEALTALARRFAPLLERRLPAASLDLGPIVGFPGLSGDADVLLDGVLLELKCVSDLRRDATTTIRQLLVYAALLPEIPLFVAPTFLRQGVLGLFATDSFRDALRDLGPAIRRAYGRPQALAGEDQRSAVVRTGATRARKLRA